MENVFYDRQPHRKFDLKGSYLKRHRELKEEEKEARVVSQVSFATIEKYYHKNDKNEIERAITSLCNFFPLPQRL